jgi:ectoine hydroxylase-related dioxygenase (phytanoyl-CoA dioxygenase family)
MNINYNINDIKNYGYVIIKSLISIEYCNKCLSELNESNCNILNLPETNIPYLYTAFNENTYMYKILENKKIKDIVTKILGEKYKLLWFKLLNKVKWVGQDVEYHQEIIYNQHSNINQNESFQLFIALNDHTKENGCLNIIPKSHKNIEKHDEFFDKFLDHKYRVNNNSLTELYHKYGLLSCELNSGDCIFFYDTTIHGSSNNISNFDRYGLAISFVKKDVKVNYNQRENEYKRRLHKSINYVSDKLKIKNDKLNNKIVTPDIFKKV